MSNVANINAISMSTVKKYSWRTDGGIKIDVGGMQGGMENNDPDLTGLAYLDRAEEFLDALRGNFPEVNTIRLDFNIYTLNNQNLLADWENFAAAAAGRGYQLIIQNSDGVMSNSEADVTKYPGGWSG
ncbi:MAG: hypothetical protein ACK5LJ_18545 [Paracoccus sp. (in: a-proteobacteria)]